MTYTLEDEHGTIYGTRKPRRVVEEQLPCSVCSIRTGSLCTTHVNLLAENHMALAHHAQMRCETQKNAVPDRPT